MAIERLKKVIALGAELFEKVSPIKINEIIDEVNDLSDGVVAGAEHITDTTNSTSVTTGALIVDGGAGIAKAVVIGGQIKGTVATDSTTSVTGAVITAGGLGVAKAVNIGTTLGVASTTDSTTKDTGSIITEGGIGVEKAIVTGTSITAGTDIIVSGTTDSTTSTTGSLKTAGGLGVAKAITGGTTITSIGAMACAGMVNSGSSSITGAFFITGTQTLTGAGAVNLSQTNTLLVTTGENALTLAAGVEGQYKFIRMKTDGGDGTLTVTNLQGGTTITFDDAGDFVYLLYLDAKWNILTNSGCTVT